MKLAMKAMQSICKISYNYDGGNGFGTGFFMKFSDSLKLLITNYHVINPKLMNIQIEIKIWNNEKMENGCQNVPSPSPSPKRPVKNEGRYLAILFLIFYNSRYLPSFFPWTLWGRWRGGDVLKSTSEKMIINFKES